MTKGSDTKFFNLVLSSPYTYNIQYTIWKALLLHYFSKMFTWRHETKNVAIKQKCNNGIPLKVTNQTDPSIKKKENWDIDSSTCC
jgi:hypothetical protein